MWKSKHRNEDSKWRETNCPVCKAYFGERDSTLIFAAHCEECRATFYWKAGMDNPTALLDKKLPQKCGCKNCGR